MHRWSPGGPCFLPTDPRWTHHPCVAAAGGTGGGVGVGDLVVAGACWSTRLVDRVLVRHAGALTLARQPSWLPADGIQLARGRPGGTGCPGQQRRQQAGPRSTWRQGGSSGGCRHHVSHVRPAVENKENDLLVIHGSEGLGVAVGVTAGDAAAPGAGAHSRLAACFRHGGALAVLSSAAAPYQPRTRLLGLSPLSRWLQWVSRHSPCFSSTTTSSDPKSSCKVRIKGL